MSQGSLLLVSTGAAGANVGPAVPPDACATVHAAPPFPPLLAATPFPPGSTKLCKCNTCWWDVMTTHFIFCIICD